MQQVGLEREYQRLHFWKNIFQGHPVRQNGDRFLGPLCNQSWAEQHLYAPASSELPSSVLAHIWKRSCRWDSLQRSGWTCRMTGKSARQWSAPIAPLMFDSWCFICLLTTSRGQLRNSPSLKSLVSTVVHLSARQPTRILPLNHVELRVCSQVRCCRRLDDCQPTSVFHLPHWQRKMASVCALPRESRWRRRAWGHSQFDRVRTHQYASARARNRLLLAVPF